METLADKNSLLSSQKSSESGLQAVLHPLVLLTISDYITRHTLREQSGPIVGALIGQQNGREITIEHAFECATLEENDNVILHADWFAQRLDQSWYIPGLIAEDFFLLIRMGCSEANPQVPSARPRRLVYSPPKIRAYNDYPTDPYLSPFRA